MTQTNRDDDERVLAMLDLRREGYSCAIIGEHMGLTKGQVVGQTARIRNSDEAHVGRDLSELYW